jgi:peptidoglycan/LPS O-acetylase OafA/YrhL
MFTFSLPSVRLLPAGASTTDSPHSLLIAMLRGLAALQVAAAHLRSEMFPGMRTLADPPLAYQALAFFTGFAHQAVLVFFLISGWLVGGSLLGKLGQPQAFASYAIDRLSRLWTVLLPTFCLMLLIGLFTRELDPGAIDFSSSNDFSATVFAGNLAGLQTISLPEFGGNYALWSLANETWYYLMFPLLLAGASGPAWRRAASLAALLAIAVLLPYPIVLYFLTWLLGAIASRVRIACGVLLRLAVLSLALGVSVFYRLTGSNNDLLAAAFNQDLLCSLAFLAVLVSLPERLPEGAALLARVRRAAEVFAAFSFTLYVTHLPLIGLMRHMARTLFGADQLSPAAPLHYAVYAAMLAAILVLSWVSYLAFESHTPRVRRLLKDWLLASRPQSLRQA